MSNDLLMSVLCSIEKELRPCTLCCTPMRIPPFQVELILTDGVDALSEQNSASFRFLVTVLDVGDTPPAFLGLPSSVDVSEDQQPVTDDVTS